MMMAPESRSFLVRFCLFASLLVLPCLKARALEIYTEDLPPFSYMEGKEAKGFSVQIVREIQKRVGNSDPIQVVSWNRGYQLTQKNKDSLLFSTTRTTEREKLFHWVGPLYNDALVLVSKVDTKVILNKLDDLKGHSVGTYLNDVGEQVLKEKGFGKEIRGASNDEANVRLLFNGRVEFWIASRGAFRTQVRQAKHDPTQVKEQLEVLPMPFYIAFNPETDATVTKAWQAALDAIKKEPLYAKIKKEYLE